MTLKEFVSAFVCRNSLIRLWGPTKNGHNKMIGSGDNSVCMEWELLRGEVWQSKYNDYEVIGVKDIAVDDFYREAINIVIKIK